MPRVLVPLANGFEDIEAVSIVDVLRRGGIEVTLAGVETMEPKGANGITIKTDRLFEGLSADNFDMIVLPGGFEGTEVLSTNINVQDVIKDFEAKNLPIGAICAAPRALEAAGVLKEGFTCYPSVEESLKTGGYTDEKFVVETENIMTSRGPGTAICFGLEIVKKLVGLPKYNQLKEGLLASYCN